MKVVRPRVSYADLCQQPEDGRRYEIYDGEMFVAVEVLSPSTEPTDRGKKMQLLARYGVREYWLVDPEEGCIEVYALAGDGYRLAQTASDDDAVESPLLGKLGGPVRDLFRSPI